MSTKKSRNEEQTPKAFANFSPGLERSDNPGYANKYIFKP